MSDTDNETLAEQLRSYEQIVLDMKSEVLSAYHQRCIVTESECANLHLDACRSRLPLGECTHNDLLDVCVDEDCGMIRDFSNPTVRLPEGVANGPNLNPTDGNVIETMCYSVLLNGPLRSLYDRASAVGSSAVYFGAWTGVFRYFPGLAQGECGSYDPRIRPWYVGASSGPKDVVIVIDVSGSMGQLGRLDLAKEAAVTVVNTLGADSYVNVVTFSEHARALMPNSTTLVQADSNNMEILVELVNDLEIDLANVATNFGEAFTTTFDLLEASSVEGGSSSGCQTAIVFLTDGRDTVGGDTEETIADIEARNEDIGAQVFSYSLGALADTETAKQLACDTGGIYEHVEDGGDLSQAMAFFYRYYAIGLGQNEDFVALTDIYSFATGGELGFTIAAPVYDTEAEPPAFLGVVAIDFEVQTFLEMDYTVNELRNALERRNEGCPALSLTECQREVFRGSISSTSVCDIGGQNCSHIGSLEPQLCMNESEYPTDLWQNTDFEGLSYAKRNCCGQNYSSDASEPSCVISSSMETNEIEDSADGDSASSVDFVAALFGGVTAAVVVLLGVVCLLRRRRTKLYSGKDNDRSTAVAAAVGPPENAPRDMEVEAHQ